MDKRLVISLALVVALAVSVAPTLAKKKAEPDRVVVQHILVGFKNSTKSKEIQRSKKQAQALAKELYQRAVDGEEFGELVKEYTDDKFPGVMRLTNKGTPTRGDSHGRDQVVFGFGDMAFELEVGEIGLVPYGYSSSPFGWHIIKRLE
jgi:hypothetical protein